MLEQILRDLWVDPDLVAGLNETQRHQLFQRMREEQVKRWWERQKEVENLKGEEENSIISNNTPPITPRRSKRVTFLEGEDGELVVEILGNKMTLSNEETDSGFQGSDGGDEDEDCTNDAANEDTEVSTSHKNPPDIVKSIEEENREDPKSTAAEFVALVRYSQEQVEAIENELMSSKQSIPQSTNSHHCIQHQERNVTPDTIEEPFWDEEEQKLAELTRRTEAEVEELLKRTECKLAIRSMARKALEEHRRHSLSSGTSSPPMSPNSPTSPQNITSQIQDKNMTNNLTIETPMTIERTLIMKNQSCSSPPPPIPKKFRPAKPPNRETIIEWFKEEHQIRDAGLQHGTRKIATWFHGLVSRIDAENILIDHEPGSFLVRISERIWGYVVSFRADDRVKHFLVDASDGRYRFFGAAHLPHSTLGSLVHHHSRFPITLTGGEVLAIPCPLRDTKHVIQLTT